MSEYHYTLKDIQKRTGLPASYLARCSSDFAVLFLDRGYRTNGTNNTTLFNENGALVFERIKQLKEKGFNRPQVLRKLEEELRNQTQGASETLPNEQPTSGNSDFLAAQQLAIDAVKVPYEKAIAALQGQVAELKEKEQLLTDGRSVEEIRAAQERLKKYNEQRSQLINAMLENERKFWSSSKIRRTCLTKLKELEMQHQSLS